MPLVVEFEVPVLAATVPVTTDSPALSPLVTWAIDVVTSPTWTGTVVTEPSAFITVTV
jgi:hypothetical protein